MIGRVARAFARFDDFGGLESVHVRHLHVEQDYRKLVAQELAQRIRAAVRAHKLVTQRLEDRLQCQQVFRPVIDQEDLGPHRFSHAAKPLREFR